jgi:hypothetical protein
MFVRFETRNLENGQRIVGRVSAAKELAQSRPELKF